MPPSMKGIYGDGGGPASKMPMDMDMGDDEAAEGEDSPYSPEYMAAYEEYETAPSAETFWRAVEACVAETGKSGGGGSLAILLGKPKGKK